MALTAVKFYAAITRQASGAIDWTSGSLVVKASLSNVEPTQATDSVWADISADELADGNGYTTGGETLTIGTKELSGGIFIVPVVADVVWTATGAMGPFRFIALRVTNVSGEPLLSYYDYGSSLNYIGGEKFTLPLNGNNIVEIN